jgi:hypothetical protein
MIKFSSYDPTPSFPAGLVITWAGEDALVIAGLLLVDGWAGYRLRGRR